MDSNHRRRKPAELQSAPFGHSGNCPFQYILLSLLSDSNQRPRDYKSRALANWAKEAGVGKLTISRRYNQLPLLRSSPGGFEGSWPYRTYPYFRLRVQRYAFLLNLQYFAQTFFNFNKNTGVTNNIIYTFAPLFLMKDDREQRLLTTICHVIRHLPGRILDFEVHFISFRVNYTVPIFPLCRTNSMRAFYGVLLCTNVP